MIFPAKKCWPSPMILLLQSFFFILALLFFYNHMQEGNPSDKQIQASFDSLKAEIVVNQSELQSNEGVRRIMKKYQNRIAEMLKLIQRQKRQNEVLKADFKQLNQKLNQAIKKVEMKPKEDDPKMSDSRNQLIKKQLENEIKKNGILRKELDNLKYKFQYLDGEKIDSFKNEIKQKQKYIDELRGQIKLFQKLDRQQKSGDSYKKEEELTNKILQQNQEIVHLKKKVQEHKKKEEQLQKNIKQLREQVSELEGKVVSKPPEEKSKEKTQDKAVKEELQKLQDKYKQLQNAKKMNDKSSRQEIDSLTLKLKNLERELVEAREVVTRKDKESNIILFKLKEKERKNFNTLEPIKTARYSEEVLHSSSGGLFETRKSSKGLSWGQGIYREFDDSSKLPVQKNYRIKRLVFTYFQENILSLTTDYDIIEGQIGKDHKRETKTIQSFAIPTQYSNIQVTEHLFGDYEYILGVDVYCGKSIQFMRITTSKQHILEVGNSKILPKTKRYSFDIGSHEKPIAVMGIIEHRKTGGENRQFLVNFGLELKKKEVFIRGKVRKVESSLKRSILEKSSNGKDLKE